MTWCHGKRLPMTDDHNPAGRAARTVIVTGASHGIGRATALRLAWEFDLVTVVARDQPALELSASDIRAAGAAALPVAIDLRAKGAAAELVARTLETTGRIDAVVNIAGAVPQAGLMAMTDEQWDDGLSLKLHGARRLALAAWPHLVASGGSLLFMSGATAFVPKASLAGVSTINAAILALAKAFAEQGLADGVQVNSIQPGSVMTDRRLAIIEQFAQQRGLPIADAIEVYAHESGIANYGRPEDIAELVAFLLSPGSRWMTGSTLRMDGGETRSI